MIIIRVKLIYFDSCRMCCLFLNANCLHNCSRDAWLGVRLAQLI